MMGDVNTATVLFLGMRHVAITLFASTNVFAPLCVKKGLMASTGAHSMLDILSLFLPDIVWVQLRLLALGLHVVLSREYYW